MMLRSHPTASPPGHASRTADSRVHVLAMKTLCTLVLALAVATPALADFPFKKKPQEFTTRRPNEVAETLRSGTPVQRNDLALELGILAPGPSNSITKTRLSLCGFQPHRGASGDASSGIGKLRVARRFSACDSTYVVVFDKAPKSEWRHVQTVRLPTRSQRPAISFAELIQTGVSEILVHHEITSDSGRVTQQNFVILKMLHGRIEVVLRRSRAQRNHADQPHPRRN